MTPLIPARALLFLLFAPLSVNGLSLERSKPAPFRTWGPGMWWRMLSRMATTSFPGTTPSPSPTTTLPPSSTLQSSSAGTTRSSDYKNKRKEHAVKDECEKLGSRELLGRLADEGDYNQLFMAQTPEEAGRHFARSFHLPLPAHADDPDSDYKPKNKTFCGNTCQRIRSILEKELLDSQLLLDDVGGNVTESPVTPSKTCSLDKFVQIGDCANRGEQEVWGYRKLCSACHGVYILGSNCFPQFFNGVTCSGKASRCIYDWWTGASHGKCEEKTLPFTALRNRGTSDCERWRQQHLRLPIACECYLSASSWLRA